MYKRLHRQARAVFAGLLVMAAAGAGRAAGPEILEQVPGDCYGLLVINNARTFANKVSNAATRLNISLPPDLVGWATGNLGITQGFDANGSAALVLLKPSPEKLAEGYFKGEPPAVLLLPTTSSKDMLTAFKPGEPDKNGISEVTLPSNPEEKGYVAVVQNKWVAMAQKREDLASYLARGEGASFAKTVPAETLKVFDANDMVIWGNVEKLGAGVDKWLDEQQAGISGMLDLTDMIQKPDALSSAIKKQAVNGVFALAREFFKDANASMITVRLTDSGATLGLAGDFKPDTPLGKFVMSQAAGEGAAGEAVSLKGLPGGNFLLAGSMKVNGETIAPVFNSFMDQILTDPAVTKDERVAELRKMVEMARPMIGMIRGARFVFLDPPAGGKNGLFNGSFLLDVTDAQRFMNLEAQVARSPMAQTSLDPDYKQSYTFTPDAVTIKDVKLSKISVKISLREETAENPIPPEKKIGLEMIQHMYGPDGITAYVGVVGKRVIWIYGSDNGTLESSIAAAQADSDDLAGNAVIAETKDQIVANPVMVMYLPIARWIVLAQAMIKPPAAGGGGGGGELPPGPNIANAPAAVISAGVSGKLMTAEVHVPIATITGTQEAITRLQRALREGGGGAGRTDRP